MQTYKEEIKSSEETVKSLGLYVALGIFYSKAKSTAFPPAK